MSASAGLAGNKGFTLLELMVVLALLGLLSAMALPRMQRWHDAVQARAQAAELVGALREAAFAAGAQRRRWQVTQASFDKSAGAAEVLKLSLPPGWSARMQGEPVFLPSGLCVSGALLLRSERGTNLRLQVQGPRCSLLLEALGEVG